MKHTKIRPSLAALVLATSLAHSVAQMTTCGETNLPGNYVTYFAVPSQTDSRISGKNSPEFACLSTNGPRRNQLVVFLPGTDGVPRTFENFVQNAANLGFHALALTYDNDTSLASFCAADTDPDCYFKVRYEFLTGSNTTSMAVVTRPNSIEFRLAAFLHWLNTNNPAENWGQYLTATNPPWTNALAWHKFLLAGHSQGSGYAGFIGKLQEVERVVMFAGGDWWLRSNQPPAWASLPSATPPERWFHFTHLYDPGEFDRGQQVPAWEAFGQMRFAPVVNVDQTPPPYAFSHALTSLLEPCTNSSGQIDYHNGTINDPPLLRDANGIPIYNPVWTHMLTGVTGAPAPANLIADSVRDFSTTQGGNGWFYGVWNRTANGAGGYQVSEFNPLPSFGSTLFATPAWGLSNDLQIAVWQTAQRPHGVNTNACCTNRASGPELWPVRRWVSSVSGPVTLSGHLAKWDSAGGDGVVGQMRVDGSTVWSALIEGTNVFGTNFSVAANVSVGSFVDFLVSPGPTADADHDGTYFTVQITQAPMPPWPVLYISSLGSNTVELTWEGRTNYSYQIEQSVTLAGWQAAGRPLAAPAVPGWMTNALVLTNTQAFFRLVATPLTDSPVPLTPGVYDDLAFTSGGIARNYRLNLPTNYTGTAGAPAPLAFILHGHGQTADSFAAQHPDLAGYANHAGLILVIPQSTTSERGSGWVNFIPEHGSSVDDAAFLLELLEHLAGTLTVDRQRVYAGGFSNGGQLVHYLGARTTNVFAAFASVGSAIGGGQGGSNLVYAPPPVAPAPILIVNATNDCTRPYWGGLNEDGQLQASVQEAADHWTTNVNACFSAPVITTNHIATNFVNRFSADCGGPYPPPAQVLTNQVIRSTWIGCSNWVEVQLVTLTDGGHLWPDAADRVGFDANREVIEFFLRHCRCEAPGATNTLVVPTTPGQYERSFCDQGYWRKFRLAVPAAYNGLSARPLLFTFHGGEQSIAEFGGQHPDLFAKCNTEGMLLVLPEATRHPYSRETLWGNKPFDIVVDDRVFVTNLLEQLEGTLNINRKKVYAAGFSSGGRFCNWFASTRPGFLAGIAPVCSQIGWNDPLNGALVAPPTPVEPLPVMMVRGSLDQRQPFFGGTNDNHQLTFSATEDLDFWVTANPCLPPPVITTVGVVTAWHFTTCAGGAEAKLEGVAGLGHEWQESAAYNASIRVVDFLLRFTRP